MKKRHRDRHLSRSLPSLRASIWTGTSCERYFRPSLSFAHKIGCWKLFIPSVVWVRSSRSGGYQAAVFSRGLMPSDCFSPIAELMHISRRSRSPASTCLPSRLRMQLPSFYPRFPAVPKPTNNLHIFEKRDNSRDTRSKAARGIKKYLRFRRYLSYLVAGAGFEPTTSGYCGVILYGRNSIDIFRGK